MVFSKILARLLWKFPMDFVWLSRLFSQFKVEDSKESTSGNSPQPPTSPTNGTTQDPLKTASARRLDSSSVEKEVPVTPNRSDDDKGELVAQNSLRTSPDRLIEEPPCTENDKENDNRSGQATQAMIQRRRRPKRRSTGVVHVDMEVKFKNTQRGFKLSLTLIPAGHWPRSSPRVAGGQWRWQRVGESILCVKKTSSTV